MGLETLLAMGGMLLLFGGFGMWSHSRRRVRGTRGRVFSADAALSPQTRESEP